MIKSFESKKIMALPMMMIFGILSYGTNVDDLILQYEKNSYTTKINEKSMKKFDIKDKALKNGDWNEITVNSDNNYTLHGEANGLTMENNVKYGIFYYRNGYNFRSKEVTQNKIGISKTLNDFFDIAIIIIIKKQIKFHEIYRKLLMKLLKIQKLGI